MPDTPPTGTLERIVVALGNLARPYVLFVSATSSAVATVMVVAKEMDLMAGAAFVAANWGGVGLLYGAKSLEEGRKAKAEAQVAIAQNANPVQQDPAE
jgi:hypothetical protein